MLSAITTIIKTNNINQGGIEIACDEQSALKQLERDYLHCTQTGFDILQDIQHRIKMLPIKIKWKWVKGHKLEKTGKENWWERQNRRVDLLAKNYLQKCINNKRKQESIQLHYEKWALFIEGEKQSQVNKKKLYSELKKEATINYWRNHHAFKIKDENLISWTELGKATKSLPTGIQRQ